MVACFSKNVKRVPSSHMAKAPQAEQGADRQIERAEVSVGYTVLVKPELREVPEEELLEGYVAAGDGEHHYNTKAAFEELAKQIVIEQAENLSRDALLLWNKETGQVFREESEGAAPRWHAAALRKAGFSRFIASAEQLGGGLVTDGFDSPGGGKIVDHYYPRVYEDASFGFEADYLASQDQLSDPFEDASDAEFCETLLDAIAEKTAMHRYLEGYILQSPSNHFLGEHPVVSLSKPLELEIPEIPGLLEGPFADPPISEGELVLCKYRGPIPSIPELSRNDWAVLEVKGRAPGKREFLEATAARIGHGARVYVEGGREKPQVLVPIKIDFAT